VEAAAEKIRKLGKVRPLLLPYRAVRNTHQLADSRKPTEDAEDAEDAERARSLPDPHGSDLTL